MVLTRPLDAPATVPVTIGALLLLAAWCFRILFYFNSIDMGLLGRLQFYSCISATIAVIGHIINAYGQYQFSETGQLTPSSVVPCYVEAICSCFGELSLVLWLLCSAIMLILSIDVQRLRDTELLDRIFVAFHVFVWLVSFITTIVPGLLGFLGLFYDPNQGGPEGSYCWFSPGHKPWEIGQYYAPLCLTVAACIAAFIFMYCSINKLEEAKQSDVRDNQRAIVLRLAFQLFALLVMLVPDAVGYFMEVDTSNVTYILWRCETGVTALIWFTNMRVRSGIWGLACMRPVVEFITTHCSCCVTVEPSRPRRSTDRSSIPKTYNPPPEAVEIGSNQINVAVETHENADASSQ